MIQLRDPRIAIIRVILSLLFIATAVVPADAMILPVWMGDHMVLQRDTVVPITGRSEPGVAVQVEFAGQSVQTVADADGRWRVEMTAMPVSAVGRAMVIKAGDETVVFDDVLVGEVWVCAGQSNMGWPLDRTPDGEATAEAAARMPELRLLDPQPTIDGGKEAWSLEAARSLTPQSYFKYEGWAKDSAEAAGRFSAVGFYFGKTLQEKLGVPVGLIDVAVGGTPIQAWVPRRLILDDPALRPLDSAFLHCALADMFINQRPTENLQAWIDAGRPEPMPEHYYRPGFMYTAGIEPFAGLPIAGIVWYQGESNAEDAPLHNRLFPEAVKAWRESFGRDDLPVFWAQLPGIQRYAWPEFRESQAELTSIPNTGMAVTIELGDPANVHPRVKLPVGERLARLALHQVYRQPVEVSGPTPASVEKLHGAIGLTFDHTAHGLELRPSENGETGFWVAGEDRRFERATAELVEGRLIVRSDAVPEPVAVRYAWETYPPVTLFNSEGLPAAPFRTDDWPAIRVACVGDSITFGMGTSNPNLFSYPAQLEQKLGPLFDVRNYGVSGSTVVNGFVLKNWDRGFALQLPYERSLVALPDVVVINLGINDINEDPFDAERFVKDYLALIESYRSLLSHPKILIWGRLAPLFTGHKFYGEQRLDDIHAAIDRVASQADVRVIDMATPLAGMGEHFPDQIHPDDLAAGVIADSVAEALNKAGLPVPESALAPILTGQVGSSP